ncbi:MAG TPA: tetraacyldisaccharide 4'-kinase, partial [Burkholderiaceae bacterium]|nr:tetraacyldisaccharide 4'-kinase [Burkholderiaceae bacterium]
PVSIAIARGLGARGGRVGLIASGYGTAGDDARIVRPDSPADQVGDEALLLARATGRPVAVAPRRDRALQALLADAPDLDVVVIDDGLQHRWLPRTVELLLFDARGAGNGRLLPAGPLREPLAAAREADAMLLAGAARPPVPHRRIWRFDIVPTGFRPLGEPGAAPLPIDELAARIGTEPALAIAGIAQPQRFFEPLRRAGLTPRTVSPGDHRSLDADWLAAAPERWILTTEKDAVKWPTAADPRCWVLTVEARLAPEFFDWLLERLNGPENA